MNTEDVAVHGRASDDVWALSGAASKTQDAFDLALDDALNRQGDTVG